MQMLMIQAAKGSEMLASSAIQASSNMGNALGAFLGGLPLIAGFSYTSPQYVGAGLAFTGFLFCAWHCTLLNQQESSSCACVARQPFTKVIVKKKEESVDA